MVTGKLRQVAELAVAPRMPWIEFDRFFGVRRARSNGLIKRDPLLPGLLRIRPGQIRPRIRPGRVEIAAASASSRTRAPACVQRSTAQPWPHRGAARLPVLWPGAVERTAKPNPRFGLRLSSVVTSLLSSAAARRTMSSCIAKKSLAGRSKRPPHRCFPVASRQVGQRREPRRCGLANCP